MHIEKKKKPSLQWAIEHATAFRKSSKDGLIAVFGKGQKGIGYTRAEFDAEDIRYLQVLDELRKNRDLQFFGLSPETTRHALRMSQLHWLSKGKHRYLPAPDNGRVLVSVVSIDEKEAYTNVIKLFVESYMVQSLPSGVEFGNMWLKNHATRVPVQTLEKWYPGSVDKIRSSFDLGLSSGEITKLVFNNEFTVEAKPLPEDFDLSF